MRKCLFTIFILPFTLFSQIKVDTSYTVFSTYIKELKKFPQIKVVKKPIQKNIVVTKDLVYKKTNNSDLHFDLYYKKTKKTQPVVVLIHGGGWKSGNKNQMQFLAQEIAKKGYTCFCVKFRLSDEAKYPAAIIDVKTVIKHIKTNALQFNINPNKVAVLGCSSGGQMAALIGTTNNNPIFDENLVNQQNSSVHAIIDLDGILAFHHPESQEGKAASYWLDGTYEEKPQLWEQASALTHCDKNTPPTLFINSEIVRFHAGQKDMIAILHKNNIYNEVKTIKNSPHSFWFFDPYFDEMMGYITGFLKKVF